MFYFISYTHTVFHFGFVLVTHIGVLETSLWGEKTALIIRVYQWCHRADANAVQPVHMRRAPWKPKLDNQIIAEQILQFRKDNIIIII